MLPRFDQKPGIFRHLNAENCEQCSHFYKISLRTQIRFIRRYKHILILYPVPSSHQEQHDFQGHRCS